MPTTKKRNAATNPMKLVTPAAAVPPVPWDGEIFLDDENCTQCARCEGSVMLFSPLALATHYTARVSIEIYPQKSPAHENAYITLEFCRWTNSNVRDGGDLDESERTSVACNWNELEPLAAAFSRAVELAKARGFLPARNETLQAAEG